MDESPRIPGWKDKALYTPGPLTTSASVKQAMLRDMGSRDEAFIAVVRSIRDQLVALAGADPEAYTAIPMQGSGTFGLEAVVASAIPPEGRLLVAINGAYGRRIAEMAERLGIGVACVEFTENEPVKPARIGVALEADPGVTHVAVCHCETTSGILNPVEEIGAVVHAAGKRYFVDAMSSFGAIPLKMPAAHIDYLVSSANKCIEGVPGFSFVIARLDALEEARDGARSLSLDLWAQYQGLEKNGQFRFTPPTHALLAFGQALEELEAEGGIAGRNARYTRNHRTLRAGTRCLGLKPYLPEAFQSPIITSFHYPADPAFDFVSFYQGLSARGYLIYPGKVGSADCFRIGTIGRLFEPDMQALVAAMRAVLKDMGVQLPDSPEEE